MIYKVLKLHNIDNNSICKRVYEIQSNDHSLVVEGSSSYLTEYNYIKDKAFKPLLNEITNILNGYYIEDVWFNIYKKGGYVKPHHHNTDKSNKYLSAIYNVKKPLNSGDFYLSNNNLKENYSLVVRSEGIKIIKSTEDDGIISNKRNNNLVKSPNNGKIIEAKFLGGSTIVHLALNGMKDYDHLHIKIPGINYFENNQIVNLYTDVNYSYIFET